MAFRSKQAIEDTESASFDLILAVMLLIGAICLVCAVNYGAAHGVNEHVNSVFVMLHRYYVQWIIAGLAVLIGAGMCKSALRRMNAVPKDAKFPQGAVALESSRWLQQSRMQPPANSRR
ncbi:MAG TPA: hypothetical protein VFB96_00055 [Pirellulaceae bacterium]|jgi:hypothetical protein|nr:hypothetical protein [Pirellulaceae bacterium]